MDSRQPPVFNSLHKTFGILPIYLLRDSIQLENFQHFIKILLVPAGCKLIIDFQRYNTQSESLFFINSNQYLELQDVADKQGYLIYYTREFYCIHVHDNEVSCDGLLFNNLSIFSTVKIESNAKGRIHEIFTRIIEELKEAQSQQQQMIRCYLKQLIILSTRRLKEQHFNSSIGFPASEIDFFRQFNILVETHFKTQHTVADYALLLGIAPKTLSNKLRILNMPHPNEIIKERIILEAKKLLVHTSMSAKQIAYHLGYDDPAYFSRLFVSKVGLTPSAFKRNYHSGRMSN